ncbi:thymidylate synthase [Erwinia phage AH04]|uniref:thymidylate synthase n=1 Tax=Erwinia phage AH04 TaxID=2869569 RepID=A0AAE8BQF2_9CAUD|nr:thymidylate synthase [Erwinia phage AH04]QZA70696.1 thymidylate synthase [Erwinia phage AH04]
MKNKYEKWYMETLAYILANGQRRGDRTGTGVISMPNIHYTHDLRENYPVMFSRYFNIFQPITEMNWMMSGSSNIQYLKDNGCPFWNGFATKDDMVNKIELNRVERLKIHANDRGVPFTEMMAAMAVVPVAEIDELLDKHEVPNMVDEKVPNGELGPVYGVMWRNWPNPDGTTFDQLQYAFDVLKRDPNSRRVVVDCWNPSFLPDPKISPRENAAKGNMALTPCHFNFGFYTWELSPQERYGLLPTLHEGELTDKIFMRPGEIEDNWDNLYKEYNIPTHYLDISFTMRSNDWVLGQPANMNMYSALLMMFAQQLNMIPRYVNYWGWDSHIYTNHLEGVAELIRRWDTGEYNDLELKLDLNKKQDLYSYHHTDFIPVTDAFELLMGERIKFPIAI